MTDIGDEVFYRIGGILHESRMRECYGKMEISSRAKWPETFKDFRRQRHDGQPWIDVAIAQVRGLIKAGLIQPEALLAQWIEQRTSNSQVEGSNPSERTTHKNVPGVPRCPTCGFGILTTRTAAPFVIEDFDEYSVSPHESQAQAD
jgi:hypothetical protein